MRQPLELRLGFSPLGYVLMRPGDAADIAFGTVHGRCGELHMNERAILALPQDLFVANGLAIARALIHFQGRRLSLGRHHLHDRAGRLRRAVTVKLLCPRIPQRDAAL